LFVDGDRVLLVRKTYGYRWDIPGGYVDAGESPAAACEREVRVELGLDRRVERLVAVDWAPSDREGDKLLWLFDCGALGVDESRIRLDETELDRWEWVPVGQLADRTVPRLARRLASAYAAHRQTEVLYLEHGDPVLADPEHQFRSTLLVSSEQW
jgi:8-oxo-dGTP pyrophosphatase MutT (NUDIX family)